MILNDIQIGLSRFSLKAKAESGNWQHPSLSTRHGCRLGWFIDPDDRSFGIPTKPTARTVTRRRALATLEGMN